MLGSFLPIPVSNAEVIQITNVKRKSKHWLWILVIISVLLLTSGIGVIGYEMHRQSSHSNLVNSKIIVRDDNPVGEVKDENKDFILEDNNFDEQIIEEEIIDISQYSYDFTKNPLNLIEAQALDIALIKPELLKLSEISHPLQTLLENNKLKITLLQEPEMINDNVEYIILLQLDAINIKRYTGQAVLHLGVKVKPVVASGVININGLYYWCMTSLFTSIRDKNWNFPSPKKII
ncbi:MAG: hypothetical protein EHV01_005890 [Spiroplasma sp. hy2]|uniref:hypothetical protein n=1 Tax=Spiroplasma sp. hy2 TaxID=2490850 RepID=UPI003B4C4394